MTNSELQEMLNIIYEYAPNSVEKLLTGHVYSFIETTAKGTGLEKSTGKVVSAELGCPLLSVAFFDNKAVKCRITFP